MRTRNRIAPDETFRAEVESFDAATGTVTLRGNFTPGDTIALRPGARVAIVTDPERFDGSETCNTCALADL